MHQRYGFELIRNDTDSKVFRTSCVCMDKEDDLTVELEYIKDTKELILSHYVNTYPAKQFEIDWMPWYKNLWEKVKLCKDIITGKPIKFESVFQFRGRGHVEDYCDMVYLLGKDVVKESTELEGLKKEYNKLKDRV